MRKIVFAAGLMSVVMILAGCRSTQVAEVKRSQEEIAWEKIIRDNYPNYRPPRSAAPAVYDNTEERVSVRTYAKPADAPAAEEKAVELEAVETAPAEKNDAVAAETAPAEKTAAVAEKAPEAKADSAPVAEKVAPPDPADSTVYVVQSGDTLGRIAQKHYGSARHSNMIFKANSDILKDPNKLRPGMKLIVPKL